MLGIQIEGRHCTPQLRPLCFKTMSHLPTHLCHLDTKILQNKRINVPGSPQHTASSGPQDILGKQMPRIGPEEAGERLWPKRRLFSQH
jgi:hypothetical protein